MTIFSIFRRPPPASILAFLQSDFACQSHGTGAILRRVFRQIFGTFRGQKVHFSAILDHFFDFSRQFLLRFWVRNHKTTHQHMPNNFVFHHIPILGPKKYPPPDWVTVYLTLIIPHYQCIVILYPIKISLSLRRSVKF